MTAAYQQNGQLRGGGGGYSGERAPQLKRVGRGAGGSKATGEERKVRRRETERKRNSAFNSVESSEGLPQCTHTHTVVFCSSSSLRPLPWRRFTDLKARGDN